MSAPLTFAGNPPYPRRRNDYGALVATARRLLAQREQRYPDLVAKGSMTQADADRGIRIMAAVVEQWRRVTAEESLPETADYREVLGATWLEIAAELASAAARTATIAAKQPEHRGAAEQAELTAALAWHETATLPGSGYSHINLAHEYAQWERRRERSWRGAA